MSFASSARQFISNSPHRIQIEQQSSALGWKYVLKEMFNLQDARRDDALHE